MTWETVPLGEVAIVNPRASDPADTTVTFLGMADLGENGRTTSGTALASAEIKSGYTPFDDRDLLVAKITPCFENGKIGQVEIPTESGWGSTEFHVVRPDESKVDDRYLLHFLRTPRVRALGEMRMTGSAGQKRVPVEFIRALRVPLPPLAEQRRIAAILDEAEALRSRAREELTHLESTEDALFASTLGRTVTGARTLSDYAIEFRYGTSQKSGPLGAPVLRIPNITGRDVDVTDLKTVDLADAEIDRLALADQDVLFVRSNGNPAVVGRAAAFASVPPELRRGRVWVYASYLIRARLPSTVSPRGVVALTRSPTARRHLRAAAATSAGQYNISIPVLRGLPMFDPHSDCHAEFERGVDGVDRLRSAAVRRITSSDDLFSSLQYRAFRGEL